MSNPSAPYQYQYERIASSQSLQPLGGVGAKGDYLDSVLIESGVNATSTISLFDGGVLVANLLVASASFPSAAYSIPIRAVSQNGPWQVTTGALSACVANGIFSA